MSAAEHRVDRSDILSMDVYNLERKNHRARVIALKKDRRIFVGPHCTVYFESYETMWFQVHEMLRTERGGDAQISDELAAYNPLIPQGSELTATVMFEITDSDQRAKVLNELTNVEDKIFIEIGGERISASPEMDVERTKETGKTSSVHFVHFPFSSDQVKMFKDADARVILGIDHEKYSHMAILSAEQKASLAKDFD